MCFPASRRNSRETSAVMVALQKANGHTHSTLWKDISDDASYLITSEWSDEQAFLDFIHSAAFKEVYNLGQGANPIRPTAAQNL